MRTEECNTPYEKIPEDTLLNQLIEKTKTEFPIETLTDEMLEVTAGLISYEKAMKA